MSKKKKLRICIISYRSNPHSGGQGVYVRNIAREMAEMGHQVDVLAGPPDPLLEGKVNLIPVKTLDLYDPENLFRVPTAKELKSPVNLMEWLGVSTMGYPEPFTFGFRAYDYLKNKFDKYDIIHDNQSLSYGIWAINRKIPVIATIHHPMTVDRKLAIASVRAPWKKLKHYRWYSFIGMQKRVSRKLPKIITVSEFSKNDISREYKIDKDKFIVVPNGINLDLFHPMEEINREPNTLICTNSADTPLKGLYYLLQAVYEISKKREIKLTVIGKPKENGGIEKLIKKLGISNLVNFTGRLSHHDFVKEYAKSTIAVVPSVYEGFGIPVGEAMATKTPVITTSGGALPEVAGDASIIVPPKDPKAIENAVNYLLDNPQKRKELGEAGFNRVHSKFTWRQAAEKTIKAYEEVIYDNR
jgi:glycosyltransferase involved in cell wall biosynthesis